MTADTAARRLEAGLESSLKQLQTDPPLDDDVFRLPERLGWQVKVERLGSLSQ